MDTSTYYALETLKLYRDLSAEGVLIKIREYGDVGTFDTETMSYSGSDTPVDVETYAITKNYHSSEIDGDIIQRNDFKIVISSYGFESEITTSHKVIINSQEFSIINVEKISPAGVIVGYVLQIRG